MAISWTRGAACGDVLTSWIKTTAAAITTSPVDPLKMPGAASVGSAVLARGVIRTMMWTKLKTIAFVFFTVGLAPAILALAVAKTRFETTPDEARLAFQEGPAVPAAKEHSATKPGKGPIAGTIVLLDGTPARDARVFVSVVEAVFSQGHLRAETRADAQGRFSLDIAPVEVATASWIGGGTLWAYRPGSRAAFTPFYRGALAPGLPQRFVLGPPAHTVFEVRGPDGQPVAGARVEPRRLNSHDASVPEDLASHIGASTVTDAHGRAVMTAFTPEEIESVRVVSENYGPQDFRFKFQELIPEPRVLSLHPAGRLKGRLVGDPDAVRRRPLRVVSFQESNEQETSVLQQEITTDVDGRFDIPATAAGRHFVSTIPRSDFRWYASTGASEIDVKPGQTTEVGIPLKRAIRVRGFVREKGTGKPIEGARVGVTIAETTPMTTDPNGRYEGYVPPEITMVRPWSVPPGYAMPAYGGPRQQRVPENVEDFEVETLELMRAGELLGLVVDDNARPVAGAEVEASWNLDESGPGTGHHRLTARTGPDGRFVVDRVPVDAEVALSAHHRGVRTAESRTSRVGEATILRLTVESGVSIEGRVLDPTGRPVAGALVHLRSSRRDVPHGPIKGSEQVAFEGGTILVADAEGRFRTPPGLDSDGEYAAYASAVGYRSSRTYWTRGGLKVFTGLTLQPEAEAPAKSSE